jgi:hypothetical protein
MYARSQLNPQYIVVQEVSSYEWEDSRRSLILLDMPVDKKGIISFEVIKE